MVKFHVIIPARYGSGRLPGKPLADIAGKPMIQHVVEAARRSDAAEVVVATDDRRIKDAVEGFGGDVVMTRADHASGSDRIAEACSLLGLDDHTVVVNLQGDEPLMPAALLNQVAGLLDGDNPADMATLATPLKSDQELMDPAIVKVVMGAHNRALYFSRAPVPWVRSEEDSTLAAGAARGGYRHLGLYAYSSGYIRRFAARSPSPLEQLERLEQLRALWHGEFIACVEASEIPGPGVDNPADLENVRRLMGDRLISL